MLRLVVTNQKGGDAKTTTTVTLARYFADLGKKVLVIDTDPQGGVSIVLGIKAADNNKSLHNFLIKGWQFEDCLVPVHPKINVLPSNRQTVETESVLMGHTARELTFRTVFTRVDENYDVVLVDVAPSISLLQTCAMLYAEHLLIPTGMDPQSLQGVVAAIETPKLLTELFRVPIRPVAILPVRVDRRLAITTTILKSLEHVSAANNVPVLPAIRTDATVTKASRFGQFLIDYDKDSKALADYVVAFDQLRQSLKDYIDEPEQQKA